MCEPVAILLNYRVCASIKIVTTLWLQTFQNIKKFHQIRLSSIRIFNVGYGSKLIVLICYINTNQGSYIELYIGVLFN